MKKLLVFLILTVSYVVQSQTHIDSFYCITGSMTPFTSIWIVPQNVSTINVKCWGGGGAGGYATGQACAGGGGEAEALYKKLST